MNMPVPVVILSTVGFIMVQAINQFTSWHKTIDFRVNT